MPKMESDAYSISDNIKIRNGETRKRERLSNPALAERRTRAEQPTADAAIVKAELEKREKAKRVNMERL